MLGAILFKKHIIESIKNGKISTDAKIEDLNIGPNSVNVTLGKTLKVYTPAKIVKTFRGDYKLVKKWSLKNLFFFLDIKKQNEVFEFEIPEEGLILSKKMFYLGYTNEKMGSDFYIPMYEGRSSTARLGIVSHLSAGFGDVGFKQQWTLEIAVKEDTKLYKNMEIGQVYFMNGSEEIPSFKYEGKYTNQSGAQESKMFEDKTFQ
jgi:dCTP deaminase